MDLLEIGPAIRAARKEMGISQAELAQRAGTVRSRIDALENGRQADMGYRLLINVLNSVNIDLRMTTFNANRRPTLDDIDAENAQEDWNAPGLGGR